MQSLFFIRAHLDIYVNYLNKKISRISLAKERTKMEKSKLAKFAVMHIPIHIHVGI